MSRDLEALLEAFHAIQDSPAPDVEAREALYHARLQEVSDHLKLDQNLLHRMILSKYTPWLRANTKPTSLPPKA